MEKNLKIVNRKQALKIAIKNIAICVDQRHFYSQPKKLFYNCTYADIQMSHQPDNNVYTIERSKSKKFKINPNGLYGLEITPVN